METTNNCQTLLSAVSHEIRNPVTLINSYLQLLAGNFPEITGCTYWNTIQSEMSHLKMLLTDFSAYQNCVQLHRQPTDLSAWLSQYAAALTPLLSSFPEVRFACSIEKTLPAPEIDVCRFRQVLDNLIRNALEALADSPKADAQLCINAFADTDSLCITVSNNGAPIPPEQTAALFEPFVTHKSAGTGLGLPIARRITEAHGGTLTLLCSSECETIFEIRLPAENRR